MNEVRNIDKTYNEHYLRAEYNFVQQSARMAAKWERFMEDGDRYNLQYRTAADSRVRPEHAALHGVTLPPSDPFWAEYYPPNGWNCRCTVVQVRRSKYPTTPHDEAMDRGAQALQKDKKGMFRFNPGIQGKSVPDYNPYTISRCNSCNVANGKTTLAAQIPDNQLCQACRWLHLCDLRDSITKKGTKIPKEVRDEILSLPFEEQFTCEYKGQAGNVYQHLLHCVANVDNNFVLDVAKAFAALESDIWINPVIGVDSLLRRSYYSDLPMEANCNPDFRSEIYGYIDVKSPESENNCGRNAVHACSKQMSCVCLTNHRMVITEDQIAYRTQLIWKDPNYTKDYVFWLIDGTLRKYKRP